jgi:hypothetical protein
MKFGIIFCSKCKKGKVVETDKKTTRCLRCNMIIKLEQNIILYKTDSIHKARHLLLILNAKKDKRTKDYIRRLVKSIK